MKIEINNKSYYLDAITLEDHYIVQTEVALNSQPEFFVASYLTGCSEKELRSLTLEEWGYVWYLIETHIQLENSRLERAEKVIILDNVKYGLIDVNKMSIGEFADLDVILNDKSGFDTKIHEMLAILYRPLLPDGSVEKYDIDTVTERANRFRKMRIAEAKLGLAFFLSSELQYLRAMLASSAIQETITQSMPDLKEIIQILMYHLQDLGTRSSSYSQTTSTSISTEHQKQE